MRMSRSAWLLSKGTVKSSIKANTSRLWATKRSSRFLGGALFDAPALFGLPFDAHRRRIGLQPLRNHSVVAPDKLRSLCLRQLAVSRPRLLDCRLDLHE